MCPPGLRAGGADNTALSALANLDNYRTDSVLGSFYPAGPDRYPWHSFGLLGDSP